MRATNCWVIVIGLLLAFTLIVASATGGIGIPLPVAVIVGLGANAVLLFWEHRQKMVDLIGRRSR